MGGSKLMTAEQSSLMLSLLETIHSYTKLYLARNDKLLLVIDNRPHYKF